MKCDCLTLWCVCPHWGSLFAKFRSLSARLRILIFSWLPLLELVPIPWKLLEHVVIDNETVTISSLHCHTVLCQQSVQVLRHQDHHQSSGGECRENSNWKIRWCQIIRDQVIPVCGLVFQGVLVFCFVYQLCVITFLEISHRFPECT